MIISIILLIVLIWFNGILSASELAFLSLNKIKLKEDVDNKDKKAILISKLLSDSSVFLSTIQIGITLAGFLASAFASYNFTDYLLNIIGVTFISKRVLKTILVILITIVLSYFTLVFGELVPKRIAINNPYKIARKYVRLIITIRVIFNPIIRILSSSTNLVCKVLRIKDLKEKFTEEDIKKMILVGSDEGVIEEKEKEYILNVFKFNDITVDKVMTPKKDVVLINIDNNLLDNIKKIKETKFSRYPVYEKNENNIIGIINVKDLIISRKEGELLDLRSLVRPIHSFQYNEKIDDVFRYMQEKNESMCSIFKNNSFIGVVTVEDAVEEIVGNIYDEYDLK